jgi:hypothetical protein
MGRTKRGKLLVLSLVAVASAIACGGSSLGGDAGEPGSGNYATGATYGRGGGPTISSGGANGVPGGDVGGSVGILFGCPPSVPLAGSRCAVPSNGLGTCEYTDSCGQQVVAICHQGANWEVLASGLECNSNAGAPNDPAQPLMCPGKQPTSLSPCPLPPSVTSYQCMYGGGRDAAFWLCDHRHIWLPSQNFSDYAGAGGAL